MSDNGGRRKHMICIFVSAGCKSHSSARVANKTQTDVVINTLYTYINIYKAVDVADVLMLIEMQCEISIGVKVDDALPIGTLRY